MSLYRFPVSITYGAAGGPGVNVWDLRTSAVGGATQQGAVDVLSGYLKTFYQSIAGLFPTATTFASPSSVVSFDDPSPALVPVTAWSVAGTSSSGYAPPANAFGVQLNTSLATRRGRGRKFIGPPAVSVFSPTGTVFPANLATIQNALNALVSSSASNNNAGAIGVYSRTDKLERDVVSAIARSQVFSLRTRKY